MLIRPEKLIEVCGRLDTSGVISRFVHVPDRGELHDFQPHVSLEEDNPDITMYPVRIGYDLKVDEITHNMNRYTMAILTTDHGVEINITFTPNHYDQFERKLMKHYKKINKIYQIYDDDSTIPAELADIHSMIREYRFHAKQMRNNFWNNLLSFYFDKEKVIQRQ